jgi:hypothetical protein
MNPKATLTLLFWGCVLMALHGQRRFDSLQYWQPNLRITAADFKQDTNERIPQQYRTKSPISSAVTIHRYLDIPKKKKNRGKMLEKAYFVPSWSPSESYTFTTDSLEIAQQQLYFEIAEMLCRLARRDIDSLQKKSQAYGLLYFTYVDIANHYCAKFAEFHREYTYAVIVQKEAGAFEKWCAITRQELKNLEQYATQPSDNQRVSTQKPVDEYYILSPTLYGELKKCK